MGAGVSWEMRCWGYCDQGAQTTGRPGTLSAASEMVVVITNFTTGQWNFLSFLNEIISTETFDNIATSRDMM